MYIVYSLRNETISLWFLALCHGILVANSNDVESPKRIHLAPGIVYSASYPHRKIETSPGAIKTVSSKYVDMFFVFRTHSMYQNTPGCFCSTLAKCYLTIRISTHCLDVPFRLSGQLCNQNTRASACPMLK